MIFGITIIIFVIFSLIFFSFSSSSRRSLAPAATSAFFASASSLFPCAIKAPISFEILFLFALKSSASFCVLRPSASSPITSSTSSNLLSWNFFLIFSFTASGFSLKNLMSIMENSSLLTLLYYYVTYINASFLFQKFLHCLFERFLFLFS